jgi:hydroxymethylpyrimidine/phosphomethylpyrimidine kinase
MDELIREGYRISKDGYSYISSGVLNHKLSEKWKVFRAMQEAVKQLGLLNPVECIPEVQMNIGYALSGPQGIEDVVALPGRIGVHEGKVYCKGEPQFGASRYVASLILNVMEHFPTQRSCANIRFDETFIARAREKGLSVSRLGGGMKASKAREMKDNDFDSLIKKILKEVDNPPDMIYDEGFVGKEPMIRLFARSPLELIQKMEMIAR